MKEATNLDRIAVVIPAYRAAATILGVIERIPRGIVEVIVVDDGCPEDTAGIVESSAIAERVTVIRHESNGGVGAAMCTGFREALRRDVSVVVKLDADGQVDPGLVPSLAEPVLAGEADYAKGNRFFDVESLKGMPFMRLLGNGVLSFINKLVSGYWPVMDPTNGFVCIHADVLRHIPLDKVSNDYFFESDMLFRLSTLRAVVIDVPMAARYEGESSSLQIGSVMLSFPGRYASRFFKRILYNYFIRDFNVGTIFMLGGVFLLVAGTLYGGVAWISNASAGVQTPVGQVMIAVLPILVGVQMLLAAVNYDVQSVPRLPIHPRLRSLRPTGVKE